MSMDPTRSASTPADGDAAAWLAQARHLRHAEPSAALERVQVALAAAQQQHDEPTQAACQLLCAELHHDLSNYPRSSQAAELALALFERLDDATGCFDAERALGRNGEKLGDDAQALRHLDKALAIARRQDDPRRAGLALLSMGHVQHNAGDFVGAVERCRQALELAQGGDDADLAAKAEAGLANAFARLGEYARALTHHQRCLVQFDEPSFPRERSYILNNIANVHQALGDHASAIDFHHQSLRLKQRLQDRWGEGTSLQGLGECALALGHFDQAQAHFEASLNLARSIGDSEGECELRQSLGDLAVRRGRLDEALAEYASGLQLSQRLNRRYNETTLLLRLGQLHRQRSDGGQARDCLARALQRSEDLQLRRERQRIHEELAGLLEDEQAPALALQHLRQAYRLQREIFTEDLDTRLRHLKLHLELEQAEHDRAQDRRRQQELASMNEALARSNAELAQAAAQQERLLKALERQKRLLQRQSTQDALTGLPNRRLFDQELLRALRHSRRIGHPLSVVLCDIDDFKSINDRFSHQTGDAVLHAIGRLLVRHSRKTDLLARHGGEEFALLLNGTPGEQALGVCEKIRQAIASHPWQTLQTGLAVTLSMGIADAPATDSPEALMALADQRLYAAKHRGKNQVVWRD
ncbi:MAG: diguanylate cyclase [Burkholderiales bacterium]|nr:diguanylate cyclase [Burkholderiales bacterium]